MKITIIADDDLVEKARKITDLDEVSVIVHDALTALIQRGATRRLAALDGSQPNFKILPRRRPKLK